MLRNSLHGWFLVYWEKRVLVPGWTLFMRRYTNFLIGVFHQNHNFTDLSSQSMLFGGQTLGVNLSISNDQVTLKLDKDGDLLLLINTPSGAQKQTKGYLGNIVWHSQTARKDVVRSGQFQYETIFFLFSCQL